MGGTVTSLYDILKARKTGLSPDLYTLLRARQEMSESVITAEPPIYFKSDDTAISEYQISGDTVQNGTPTPDNPVEVLGVGDKTANLIDVNASEAGGITDTGELAVNPNAWRSKLYYDIDTTLNYVASKAKQTIQINYYDASKNHISRETITQTTYRQLTVPSNARYFKWTLYDNYGIPNIQAARSIKPMVNTGSTALPYEPYGYKIPISCGGTTVTLYTDKPLYGTGTNLDYLQRLSDGSGVEHRAWGVYVFTGAESWRKDSDVDTSARYYITVGDIASNTNNVLSTHFIRNAYYEPNTINTYRKNIMFSVDRSLYPSVEDFKASLVAQYVAGTPVTVIYQLATLTDTPITLPQLSTVKGNNELNISTTVTPKITLKGKIKQLPDSNMNALLSVMEEM